MSQPEDIILVGTVGSKETVTNGCGAEAKLAVALGTEGGHVQQ